MVMYGADVAHLRALAQQLAKAADELDTHRGQLGQTIEQVQWRGPDGDHFRQTWQSQSSPRVAEAARAIRDAATAVGKNADQQEQASAAVSSGTLNGDSAMAFSAAPIAAAVSSVAAGAGIALGELHAAVDEFEGQTLPGRINAWDTAQALAKGAGYLGRDLPGLDRLGGFMDDISLVDKIRTGTFNVFDGADVAATALRSTDIPVARLGAAAISATSYAAQQAMNTDFSPETASMAADYVVKHPMETVETIGQSILTVGTKAVGWF